MLVVLSLLPLVVLTPVVSSKRNEDRLPREHHARSDPGPSDLEMVVTLLLQRMDTLEQENTEFRGKIVSLESEIAILKREDVDINIQLMASQNVTAILRSDLTGLQDNLTAVKAQDLLRLQGLESQQTLLDNAFSSIQSDLSVFQAEVGMLISNIADLEASLTVVNAENEAVKMLASTLQQNETILQHDIHELKSQILSLQTTSQNTASHVTGLQSAINSYWNDVQQLTRQMTNVQQDEEALRTQLRSSAKTVAFHAHGVPRNVTVTLPGATRVTLILPEATLNEDNSYNTSTGLFTAPVNGSYIFHGLSQVMRSSTSEGDVITLHITAENRDVASTKTVATHNTENISVFAVVSLREGQSVRMTVEANSPLDFQLEGPMTSFSGILVSQELKI